MFIKNKILFWFLFPSIFIATVTTVFCYLHTSKVVRKNIFDQLEIAVFELQNNIEIFLSGKQGRTADFSSDGFIKNCTEEIARKDNMREYYTNVLNNHLVTSKKPLDSDILEVFVTDLNGKVISSTDAGQVGRDVSGETYFSETLKRGSYISDIHSHPDYKQNAYFDVSSVLFIKGGQVSIGIIVNRYNGDCLSRVIHRGIKGKSCK
ncbi:MAG: two-component sensor kinase [Candidatus Scalindua brodae]|uniref:Two-component sensor kinase n=1 Tax=Candidatus Scalindua brodae TaxID=237368 RepID=A0A0B0EJ33_9BACT|nr:MAG: two-component sensor kinase [Candidatus Scalindua brodae]